MQAGGIRGGTQAGAKIRVGEHGGQFAQDLQVYVAGGGGAHGGTGG